jgi:hypothetical protein
MDEDGSALRVLAIVSMAAGAAILAWAVRLGVSRLPAGAVAPRRPLNMVRSLRALLVGASLIGLGAGLLWENGWLVGLSLIIGLEELLETTVVVLALRDETNRREQDSGGSV